MPYEYEHVIRTTTPLFRCFDYATLYDAGGSGATCFIVTTARNTSTRFAECRPGTHWLNTVTTASRHPQAYSRDTTRRHHTILSRDKTPPARCRRAELLIRYAVKRRVDAFAAAFRCWRGRRHEFHWFAAATPDFFISLSYAIYADAAPITRMI